MLAELESLTPAEADALTPAAQNMRKLLSMTADNVRLEGTKLEDMIALAGAVGLPPAKVLAAMMQTGVTDNAIPFDVIAEVFLDLLLGSHPNAQQRKGPIDDAHPDGLYAITRKGSMPVSLYDVVTDFADLTTTFGPVSALPSRPDTADHPGFISSAAPIVAATDDFSMTVRVNLNALPYKGVDLTTASAVSYTHLTLPTSDLV